MESHLLEISLISAQGLKPPSANLRRMQTYAIAWVDPSAKLRTQIDHIGGENPTWNEKFLFRVTSDFLASETSGVSVEIYAVGCIKDPLVGTVRFLLSSTIATAKNSEIGTPVCAAVQIRRPSGRFYGVLNIAAAIVNDLDLGAIGDLPAICFRDIAGTNQQRTRHRERRRRRKGSEKSDQSSGGESFDLSSFDLSDGADSTTSSSSATSTALKENSNNNCERFDMAGKRSLKRLDGGILLCGILQKRGIHLCPSDENVQKVFATCQKKNR